MLLFLVTLLLVFVLSIFGFTLYNENNANYQTPFGGFCGTVDPYASGSGGSNDYSLGKNLFKENCGTCHSKNMVSDATGPALQGSLSRWNNDTVAIWNYLKDPNVYMEQSKDPWVQKLHSEYEIIIKPEFKSLTFDETKAILSYIEIIR